MRLIAYSRHHFPLQPLLRPSVISRPIFPSSFTRFYSLKMKLGTHSGTFHADEALAIYLLRLLPKYKHSTLLRSRDPALLETCDLVVDVGGKYDRVKWFDHHQRGFEETFSPGKTTKLSSAGLVYKHFGPDIIANATDLKGEEAELIYQRVYENFIEAIDANDNGISAYPSDIRPSFKNDLSIMSVVDSYNPSWNEDYSNLDSRFEKASGFIGNIFLEKLKYYAEAWIPARTLVEDAFSTRFNIHSSGKVIKFDRSLPWKQHLLSLPGAEDILYVLYPDGPRFLSKKLLPEEWRGLRDDELSRKSKIDGCIFVHANGFTGGVETWDGAVKMVDIAVRA
ncbi:UPF0160 protein [Neolecta irregularis DAH-3]|uniref:UPF0160 protein n=1 Tax=Neolecta irregularis (strain DAH-3) TaxID=1198029 RepID=A0A1U7LRY7_NEOID|nr:UPF0160 protein [Neolecta irregularis DAH-3]|eukprot:OLL25440.1 UPF0160 protein [Neolecta irregularis DAH-3]